MQGTPLSEVGYRPRVCVILAAGKGTRMYSTRPKVLHQLLGRPMIHYVVETAQGFCDRVVVVVGHQGQEVAGSLSHYSVEFVHQAEQLGTAHAVMCAAPILEGVQGGVLVLCGDTPLLNRDTLIRFSSLHCESGAVLSVLSCRVADPLGYGRILRNEGRFVGIVEEKDATEDQRQVSEVNTGVYIFDAAFLLGHIGMVGRDNAQGEYYLPDLVSLAVQEGLPVNAFCLAQEAEALGINDRYALSKAEQIMLNSIKQRWMLSGVTLEHAPSVYLESTVKLEQDVVIGPHSVLKGRTSVGRGARIGAFCYLNNAEIGPGRVVPPFSVLESAKF